MNTFRKFGIMLAMFFALNVVSAQDKSIRFEQLPTKAQTFVKTHFSEANVVSILEDTEYLVKKEYSVVLNDGSEIEFYSDGDWEKVKTRTGAVPSKIVPSAILQYVNKNFPNTFIKEIKKSRKGYEVEISNGLDLEFNKSGKFLRIDD